MSNPFDENEGTLHRALLNLIRRCSSSEERRGYLLVIEQNIARRNGVPILSSGFFEDLLNADVEEILRNLTLEIQDVKMEEQVQSLGLDNSPPEEESAMGNMMRDDDMLNSVEMFNSVDLNDLSSECSEDDNFIDLNDLILNEQASSSDLTDEDVFGLHPLRISIAGPVSDIKLSNVISSSNDTFQQEQTTDINQINHVVQPSNGEISAYNVPHMFPPSVIPPASLILSTMPPSSRAPGSLPSGSLPPNGIPSFIGIPPDAIPPSNILVNSTPPLSNALPNNITSQISTMSIPPFGIISSPVEIPDGRTVEIPDSTLVQPATRTPGSANVCNTVPQLPLTMVRPRGFLPSTQPATSPHVQSPVYSQTDESKILPKTNSTSSDIKISRHKIASSETRFSRQNTAGSEGRFSRQGSTNREVISNKNSDYEAKTLPRSGPRMTGASSDYSSDASRQNSADYSEARDNNRSSSGEGEPTAPQTQPETHRGATVYRAKRISHVQLLAFLDNSSLKSELKELGAFYLISACEDHNFYNISFSGDRTTTIKAMELFKKTLPPDTTEYITEEVPIPVYPELKESGYLLKLITQMFSGVNINVEQINGKLIYHLGGPNNHVFEVVSLIKFMTSLPDKKFGMLLKLHSRLTNSVELIDRLINSAQNITKSPVLCLDCTKTEACKFLFVPGLCGTEDQYKLQKHLNVLVEKLEQAETDETSISHVDVAEVPVNNIIKYTAKEMLVIRENCAEPHEALLEQCSLPIRLIAKFDK